MAYLEIRTAQEVYRVSLDRDHLRIGRLAENDIVLRDAQISRQHAELCLTAGQWRIMDLGSTNGLHFKGRRVREHYLANGDMLLLAPDITVCFHDGPAPANATSTSAPSSASPGRPPQPAAAPPSVTSPGSAAPVAPVTPARPVAPARPIAPAMPVTPAAPVGPVASPGPSIADMLRPRSPFADDEQPYFPPGMGMPAPPTLYRGQYAPGAAVGPPVANTGQQGMGQPPAPASSQFDTTLPARGYPAPSGPLTSGSDGQDPFRRSSVNVKPEAHRAAVSSASTLLHVCQTCGQLTAPDSVYCQSCHHSIARECANCRLSLLPIQERCPRCQTPNPGSVRRAHRATGA